MVELVPVRVRLRRCVRNGKRLIRSTITQTAGIPKAWGNDEIYDWADCQFGDLIDNGWKFNLKFLGG
jgi:hypothetical protein